MRVVGHQALTILAPRPVGRVRVACADPAPSSMTSPIPFFFRRATDVGLAAQRFSAEASFGTPTARPRISGPSRRCGARGAASARGWGGTWLCASRAQKVVAFRGSTHWAGQVTPALPTALAQRNDSGSSALHRRAQPSGNRAREHWPRLQAKASGFLADAWHRKSKPCL